MIDRYDAWHTYGKVRFYLPAYTPDIEEVRLLMMKVLEQAVREYCSLQQPTNIHEQQTYDLAKDFLFDDNYYFMWGDIEMSLSDMLDILDIDTQWFREQTIRKAKEEEDE